MSSGEQGELFLGSRGAFMDNNMYLDEDFTCTQGGRQEEHMPTILRP